jgi:multiple sugar transport system substrate-binding protein
MYDPLYRRLELFERQEGLEVEVVARLPHPELNARIAEEFASGHARYDLISTHTKYAPGQRQWLTPLEADADGLEVEAFDARTLELARIGGRLYSLPRNLDVKLLLYRTDLMDGPPVSWQDLAGRAKALNGRGHYGFVFPGRDSGLFGHFYELHAMAGGTMFDGTGNGSAAPAPRLNDEAGRWALGLLRQLYETAAPPETPHWHYDEVTACFRQGQAAITTDWPGSFHSYEAATSAVAGRYAFALYPEGKAGRSIYAGCHSFAVPETVRDRPAALALLRFLTSRASQAFEAASGTLPARDDALADARAQTPAGTLASRRWELLERARHYALTPPTHARYPRVEDAIWRGIRRGLTGEVSVEAALETTEAAARRAAEGEYA